MRLIVIALFILPLLIRGQFLEGAYSPAHEKAGQYLVLYRTWGAEHIPIDSALVSKRGVFRFKDAFRPSGYYRVGFGDDQVDLILSPIESTAHFVFTGSPLREHLQVKFSLENQRLWEFKFASRDAQAQAQRIASQRMVTDPRDSDALLRLSAEEESVKSRLSQTLDHLVMQDSGSYFAKTILADKRLVEALPEGPKAVRDAMDWGDASLVRSSVYPRAIMAILQSATPAMPQVLVNAADSIMAWAAADTNCWAFAREQLIGIFVTYGPDEVVQHMVDEYVTGSSAIVPADEKLLSLVAEQLKAAVGSVAPSTMLPSPNSGQAIELLTEVSQHRFTVLFFYSSTCDHCHDEMGPLNSVYDSWAAKGLQVLGIALDNDENEFKTTIQERGLRFPCFSELKAWGSPAARAFAVRATPSFILLNHDGRIVAKPHDTLELEQALRVLLP